jgi:hypothetical protein
MTSLSIEQQQVPERSPWWVGAVYKIGIPSAIALYLVYALVQVALFANSDSQQKHIAETTAQTQLLKDTKDSSFRTEGYLRLICVRLSKTDADRATCLTLR